MTLSGPPPYTLHPMNAFTPREHLAPQERRHGLRMVLYEAMANQTMAVLTTGAFLVGFALELGASNTMIGLLAGLGPLALVMQIPAVYVVERWRRRKPLAVGGMALSRLACLAMAAAPWLGSAGMVLPFFLVALLMHYGAGAFCGGAYNSWYRDLVPDRIMGRFSGRRLAGAVGTGAVVSLAGGFGIDAWNSYVPLPAAAGYSLCFFLAGSAGLVATGFLMSAPEPAMPREAAQPLLRLLLQPLRDGAFRPLLVFLAAWNFACNFAAPFFAVYMLQRLGMSMSWVIGLTVLSQLINASFFPLWGRLADRYTNKSVMAATAPLFIGTFLLWPFTTMPEVHDFTLTLLAVIHIAAGITTAGVNLCATNLAFKLAPLGRGGSYWAVNNLVSGAAAALAPMLAGVAADFFAGEQLLLTISLSSSAASHPSYTVPAVDLRGLDFVFVAAFLFGLYALHRLLAVREMGEVREKVVRDALLSEMWRSVRQVSTAAGMRQLLLMPVISVRGRKRSQASGPRPGRKDTTFPSL